METLKNKPWTILSRPDARQLEQTVTIVNSGKEELKEDGRSADCAVWPIIVILVGGISHYGLRFRPRQDGAHRGGFQPLPRPQQGAEVCSVAMSFFRTVNYCLILTDILITYSEFELILSVKTLHPLQECWRGHRGQMHPMELAHRWAAVWQQLLRFQ